MRARKQETSVFVQIVRIRKMSIFFLCGLKSLGNHGKLFGPKARERKFNNLPTSKYSQVDSQRPNGPDLIGHLVSV